MEAREGRRDDRGELPANQRADEMTHPFRLKILLIYYFHCKFPAGFSLKGQFDFTTHSSETHAQRILLLEAVVQDAGSDIKAV